MAKQYPKIWFLRHGQTEWNRALRLQGQLDSPLTAQGIADAERQKGILRGPLQDAPDVWVSPLGRAEHTAQIAVDGAPYKTDDRLMEIHAGSGQGRHRDEVLADLPKLAATHPSALAFFSASPGAESIAAFHARICAFLDDLTGPSVVVAHGLLGQVLRAEVLGLDLDAAGRLSNLQGCVYLLEGGTETLLEAD